MIGFGSSSPALCSLPLSHFLPPRTLRLFHRRNVAAASAPRSFLSKMRLLCRPRPHSWGVWCEGELGRACVVSAPDGWFSPPLSHFLVLGGCICLIMFLRFSLPRVRHDEELLNPCNRPHFLALECMLVLSYFCSKSNNNHPPSSSSSSSSSWL